MSASPHANIQAAITQNPEKKHHIHEMKPPHSRKEPSRGPDAARADRAAVVQGHPPPLPLAFNSHRPVPPFFHSPLSRPPPPPQLHFPPTPPTTPTLSSRHLIHQPTELTNHPCCHPLQVRGRLFGSPPPRSRRAGRAPLPGRRRRRRQRRRRLVHGRLRKVRQGLPGSVAVVAAGLDRPTFSNGEAGRKQGKKGPLFLFRAWACREV